MTDLEIDRLVQEITDEIMNLVSPRCAGGGQCGICKGQWHCANEKKEDVSTLVQLGASRIGAGLGIPKIPKDMAGFIDHTLLKPDATPENIEKLCAEAREYHFASVCIQPSYVKYSADLLKGSDVKVCTVIGFPLGVTTTAVKAYEAQVAEYDGAQEVDMVIHIGAMKSKGHDYVQNDIAAVVKAVSPSTLVKVIIETALLTDEEKIAACQMAKKAGAHFVKTSTGFASGGATAADVALMRKVVGDSMGVKASGGIKDRKGAELMVQAGASRIGASASVKIVKGEEGEAKGY